MLVADPSEVLARAVGVVRSMRRRARRALPPGLADPPAHRARLGRRLPRAPAPFPGRHPLGDGRHPLVTRMPDQYELMPEERFACGYVLEFSDGGEPEEQVLHVGTKDECARLMDLVPAVAYSGDRPIADARMVVVPLKESEHD